MLGKKCNFIVKYGIFTIHKKTRNIRMTKKCALQMVAIESINIKSDSSFILAQTLQDISALALARSMAEPHVIAYVIMDPLNHPPLYSNYYHNHNLLLLLKLYKNDDENGSI